METVTSIHLFLYGVIIASAVYCYADARSKDRWIKRLERLLDEQRKEMRTWQNKALIKHGSGPLEQKASRIGKPKQQEITPKVITRQQLEYRDADTMQNPINIHAHDVSYQRVARLNDTVERVAEVIAAHK